MTNITPLPQSIPRGVAIACLHNHVEMIGLNPLVIRQQPTTAPSSATLEEQINCVWYEITDIINYGITKGEVSYKAGFYDVLDGIQTRVFAPAGVDIKATWKVKGSMPGGLPELPELGVDIPTSGLYIREDIELRCNMFLMSFVRRNLRKPHTKLVQDLIAMAESTPSATSQSIRSQEESGVAVPGVSSSGFLQAPPLDETRDKPSQRRSTEPCSCPGSNHQVMCPNYRYLAPSIMRPESSQAPPQSYSNNILPARNATPTDV